MHEGFKELTYLQMDATKLEFNDHTFGGVFEKGTIDSMACLKDRDYTIGSLVQESYRVLQPGGYLLVISCGDPLFRVPLL